MSKAVSMNLSSKSLTNIDALSELFGETNRTRVIAMSLEITKALMEYKKNGTMLIAREKDGKECKLDFIVS